MGDSCQTSTDCDPNGNRVCDLSQPGGYCTILGCDRDHLSERKRPHPHVSGPISYNALQSLLRGPPWAAGPRCGHGRRHEPRRGFAAPLSSARFAGCRGRDERRSHLSERTDQRLRQPTRSASTAACVRRVRPRLGTAGSYVRATAIAEAVYVCRPTGVEGSFLLSATPCAQTSFCAPATQ